MGEYIVPPSVQLAKMLIQYRVIMSLEPILGHGGHKAGSILDRIPSHGRLSFTISHLEIHLQHTLLLGGGYLHRAEENIYIYLSEKEVQERKQGQIISEQLGVKRLTLAPKVFNYVRCCGTQECIWVVCLMCPN